MKRAFMVVFILLISFAFAPGGFTVSKQALIKPQTQLGTETKLKTSGFVGTVIMIDANLIQVKGKKGEVTFDASNPALTGYKDISDVVVGDTVAVQYTKDGILITKLKETAKRIVFGEKKTNNSKKVSRKTVVTRITCTGKGPCAVSVDKPAE